MKENKMEKVDLNGVTYIREDLAATPSEGRDGMEWVIVRTQSAGVFAGYLESREGKEGIVRDAIRLWSWSGAASLSQLSQEGVKNPDDCKFGVPVDKISLTETIEILSTTKVAQSNITNVEPWRV